MSLLIGKKGGWARSILRGQSANRKNLTQFKHYLLEQ